MCLFTMKRIISILTTFLCVLVVLNKRAFSQDYQISANGSQSVMACTTGEVYAWGCNGNTENNTADGRLGVGNSTDISIYRPTKVNMPTAAGKIQHVDGSSGAFLLAINCDGEVWIWGDNGLRQCGNTSATESVVTVPVYLMCGESNSSDPTAKLTGAQAISGGSTCGYAITSDNRLLAWGGGADGRLGNGSTDDQNLPVYVRDKNGNILENVIMVDGGDNAGYCLVDDGDGTGTVYSWGKVSDCMLGRSTSATNTYALPVEKEDGSPLSNIVTIAAGDVHGTAIDKDGYVWIWGNNWGGSAYQTNYAVLMEGGETNETYLQAKSIAGGNGFNMAVTLDGHVVTWGCNGSTNHSGGNLGNGTTTNSSSPVYVRVSSTALLSDVTSVSRGNSWGFARKNDNSIWTWGCNLYGVLGIGSSASNPEVYAKELDLSTITCGLPDLPPVAAMPADFSTCIYDGWSYVIDPAFPQVQDGSGNDLYTFTWKKDGVVLPGKTGETLTVTEEGSYTVVISYIGDTYPCRNPDDAEGTVTITAFIPDFTVPTDITYCGDSVEVYVDGYGIYDYYTAKSGGSYLGSTKGDGTLKIPISKLTEKSGDRYTLYVVENAHAAGIVNPIDTDLIDGSSGKTQYIDRHCIGITAYDNVVIDSVSLFCYGLWNETNTVSITVGLYTGSLPLSSMTNVDVSEEYTATVYGTPHYSYSIRGQELVIPLGMTLSGMSAGSDYYLALSSLSLQQSWISQGVAGTYPYVDNADGKTLKVKGYYEYADALTEEPPFYNIYFHSAQRYCNRLPITITSGCSCDEPEDIVITASPDYLCPNTVATLTTNDQVDATTFDFTWFEGEDTSGDVQGASYVAGKNSTLSNVTAGTYTVLVRNVTNPTSCFKTQTIVVGEYESPTVEVSGGSIYCDGETIAAPTFTFTGTAPFSFTYSDGVNASIDAVSTEKTFNPPAPSIVGEYTYSLSALSDAHCSVSATSLTSSTDIVIKSQPKITEVLTSGDICAGNTLTVSCVATDAVGATYSWTGPSSYTASKASATVSSSATPVHSGVYEVTVSLDGCSDTKSTDNVTVYPIPEITNLVASPVEVCSNDVISIEASVSDEGDGTVQWTGVTSQTLTASLQEEVTEETEKEITIAYTSTHSCVADQKTIRVIIHPYPQKPIVENTSPSSCIGDNPIVLSATASDGAALVWYDENNTKLSSAPTIASTDVVEKKYSVSQVQNECESEKETITVKVNDNLSPVIIADYDAVCSGEQVHLGLSETYYTQEWSDGGNNYLSSTSIKEPVVHTSGFLEGTIDISVTVTNLQGCTGTASKTLIVYPIPTVTLEADKSVICNNTSTTITAIPSSEDGSGVWTGATEVTEKTAVYEATEEGSSTITYVYTDIHSCESKPVATDIVVQAIPSAPIVSDIQYCQNAEAQALTATATGTLTWYDANKNLLQSAPVPSTATVATTTYYVSQTENDCESILAPITVSIVALPKPKISLSSDAVCEGTAISVALDKTYKSQVWSCDPDDYLNSTTLASPTFQSTALAGIYTLSVTVVDENTCVGSASTEVTVNPIPMVQIGTLESQCESVTESQTITATIEPLGTQGQGTWSSNVEKIDEYSASFIPNVVQAGTYTITYDFVSDVNCASKQVSTTVSVYALPKITVTPSQASVCRGGKNSSEVTMKTTGTNLNGTFVYTSETLTNIDENTGAFDPSLENAQSHNIVLTYVDEHSCEATATTSVTIHARPVADVQMNPSSLCDYDADINLVSEIDGVVTTDGQFSGIGVSARTFSPSVAGTGGPYEITYSYVDAQTQCSAEDVSFLMTVYHTDAPTIESLSESKLNVQQQSDVPALIANGENISWYLSASSSESSVKDGDSYSVTYIDADADGYMDVDVYTAYASQTMNGCVSDRSEGTVTITDCSVKAPIAVKYHACEGDASIDVAAISQENGVENIGWFTNRSDIPSGTVASLSAGNPIATGGTYQMDLSGYSAGTYMVYVAEYDGTEGTECFSPATAVSVEVHAKPTPIIDDPGMICSTQEYVTITYSPGEGSTLQGNGISGNVWTPQYDASISGVTETELTLQSEKIWGTGSDIQATCSATATRTVSVTHLMPPTGTGIGSNSPLLWSIGSITSLPQLEIIYAESIGAQLHIEDEGTEIGTSTPLSLYPDYISDIATYTYSIYQTANGCESPVAISTWSIVECPTPKPSPESIEICAGNTFPGISAQGTGSPSYEWIDSTGAIISTAETLEISSLSGYESVARVYTFKVRQDGVDAAGERCWGEYATVTATVNSLPEIVIEEVPVLCYDGGDYEIVATVDGVRSTTGTWTIDGWSEGITQAGILDPTYKGQVDGTYILEYEVQDSKSCKNTATTTIIIEYAEKPEVQNYIGIITDPQPVVLTASSIEQDALVSWYESAHASIILSSDNPYTTIDNPTLEIDKSYWVSQTVRGCESERASVSVQIVSCPFPAPVASSVKACVNDVIPDLRATTSSTVENWKWYDSEGNDLGVDADNLTHGVSSNTADTVEFAVSYIALEPVSQSYCESPKASVSVIVLPLPDINFGTDNPSVLCYGQGDEQLSIESVDYHSNGVGSGMWSIDGESNAVNSLTGIINSDFNGETTATYMVRYTYIDGSLCQNSETIPLTIQFVPTPTLTSHYSMTVENKDAVLYAELEDGASVMWYTSADDQVSVSSDNPWKTGDKGDVVVSATYYASQILNACESKRAETTVTIVSCPVPMPVINDVSMCDYEEVPELRAELGAWTQGSRPSGESSFILYDAAGSKIAENTTGVFVPNVDTSVAGVVTYYVSEWNSNTEPVGCESPKAKVSLTVKKVPVGIIQASESSVCAAPEGTNPQMRLTAYTGTGDCIWYEQEPDYPSYTFSSDATGTSYTSLKTTVGENTVWAVIYENGCYSRPMSGTYIIKAVPNPPSVASAEVCEGQKNLSVSATADVDAFITWYADEAKTIVLKTNSLTYQSNELSVGSYTYYAAQTYDGCESEAVSVGYRIKENPSMPVVSSSVYNFCTYDTAPILTAAGENIRWYLSDKTTLAQSENNGYGESFQTSDMTSGAHIYYVSQTVEGCEGPQAEVRYFVNPKPASPITADKSMCEGENEIPTLTTNLSIDQWYADSLATILVATGFQYTPSSVGSEDQIYYVVREQKGCSSDTIATTLSVIPQPSFKIDSSLIISCYGDDAVLLSAVDLDEDYHTNASIEGKVFWYQNRLTVEGDTYKPDTTELQVGKNTIYAQYFVTRDGATCASEQQSMEYEVHGTPQIPIIGTLPICLGEYLSSGSVAGVPIFARDNDVLWSSPVIDNGTWHTTRKITIPSNTLEILGAGYIPVTVIASDPDIPTCTSVLNDSIKISDIPDAEIIGDEKICAGTTNELYYVAHPESTSQYDWDLTGGNLIYTKSGNSLNTRYIDWNYPGVDTISLVVTSEDYCINYDTLIVSVAPSPSAHFVWSTPGGSNIIAFQDSTIQDSLYVLSADGIMRGEEIPYTMYWNYGHQGEDSQIVDNEVPYSQRYTLIEEDGYTFGYNCPTLRVVNDYGCSSEYSECIFINIMSSLYVPDAFAPTNPASSVRTFQPKGYNLKSCRISVYDKWGNIVWYSDEVKDGIFVGSWDGYCGGKMMSSGVYIWKMEATFLDGQIWEGFDDGNGKKIKFGSVALIR